MSVAATGRNAGARSALLGAAFLMATSAIGPGFLTQTALFTSQLGASFGFAILASIVLDIGAQLNVWRILAVSGRRAPEVADLVAPGLGRVLAVAVAAGGLAFNIGNIAGCALGLEVLLGIPVPVGALASAGIAIALFVVREAGRAMDRFTQLLGFVMIALMLYVTWRATPPLGEAIVRSVWPSEVRLLPIVTLVGGTVGGYITFAGGHRLLDAGISGVGMLPTVDRSAVTGILVTGAMRVLLFLAALGVVTAGVTLDAGNPAASVFGSAAGQVGRRLFGIVMWAAAVTSVVGASYTSASFLRRGSQVVEGRERMTIIAFIAISTIVFLLVGRPAKVLVIVGTINGFILPLALGAMLLAARRRDVLGEYRHPTWLVVFGWLVTLVMAAMSVYVATTELGRLFAARAS
jgi:Mn2+/Fe2+ NRAMP family transporter